ncbi:MAG: hypothetical protein GY765_21265, partial [bacterium]|nr:hypothetical protein [bacterium]
MTQNALEMFQQRLKQAAKTQDLPAFAQEHIRLKNGRFSFEQHPELLQLYQDMHPLQVYRKSVQVGCSTAVIVRMLWLAVTKAFKSMYLLPTDKFVKEFTPDRVDSLINNSPFLKSKLGDVNNAFQKRLGFATLYFHGLESEGNVASADIDFVVGDEVDISNQMNLVAARDRLEASDLGWFFQLSKTTVPGFGVDEAFQESDQHFRLFKCPHCNTPNNVVENIVQEPLAVLQKKERKSGTVYFFACEKCGKALDPALAEWVPKYPGRDVRGYQLSQAYWVR